MDPEQGDHPWTPPAPSRQPRARSSTKAGASSPSVSWLRPFGWAFGFYGQSVYLAELQRLHGWPTSLIFGRPALFYLSECARLVVFVTEAVRRFGIRALPGRGRRIAIALSAGRSAIVRRALAGLRCQSRAGAQVGRPSTWGHHQHPRPVVRRKKRGMAISLALNGASFGGIAGVPLVVIANGDAIFHGDEHRRRSDARAAGADRLISVARHAAVIGAARCSAAMRSGAAYLDACPRVTRCPVFWSVTGGLLGWSLMSRRPAS